jgi:hypothetical protein
MRVLFASILVALATASSASADIRTGHYNGDPSNQGSAGNPQFKYIAVRYDGQAGAITVQMVFFRPLADPQRTSLLHNATVDVALGDLYGEDGGPDCSRAHRGLNITVSLGDDKPPTVSNELFSVPVQVTATKTFSADRTELDIAVLDHRYVANNLICWSADTNTTTSLSALTGFQLLDGFTPYDGDQAYLTESNLANQATFANNNLGRVRPDHAVYIRGHPFRCRLANIGANFSEITCRGSARLPSVANKPTLSVSGTQYFTTRWVGDGYNLIWHHDERATLRWARCPHGAPKRLVGHPCRRTVRWTDTRDLWTLFA